MALKLMYRARYLALVVYGEGHPDMATFDVSNTVKSNAGVNHRVFYTFSSCDRNES